MSAHRTIVFQRSPAVGRVSGWPDDFINRSDRLSTATDRTDGALAGMLGSSRVEAASLNVVVIDFVHVAQPADTKTVVRLLAHAVLDHAGIGAPPAILAARVETASLHHAMTRLADVHGAARFFPSPAGAPVDLALARLTKSIQGAVAPGARVDLSTGRISGGRFALGRVSEAPGLAPSLCLAQEADPSDQVLMVVDLRAVPEAILTDHARRLYRRR